MPERFSLSRPAAAAARLLVAAAVVALAAACAPETEGGNACPLLCPQAQAPFQDTILDGVLVDTTLGPFPVLGLATGALVASRGDTLSSYVVVRFDVVPPTFNPNGEAVNEPITTVDSTALRFVVDTSGSIADGEFTLEVFDVDTTESDSTAAVVRSLFRPDRKVGEIVLPAIPDSDTLSIPISNEFASGRLADQRRIRLGLRIVPTANAQLRLGAFINGIAAPRLTFDPATDTSFIPLDVTPRTLLDGANEDESRVLAYTVYTLPATDQAELPPGVLGLGGLPGRRTYFRVELPAAILDSSTVVRAELLLTQRPAPGPDRGDSVGVQPFIGVTRNTIEDLYLATALSVNGLQGGVDSLRLVPADSGLRAVNIVNAVRAWAGRDSSLTRFIALRLNGEGFSGTQLYFHDSSAPADLRPRVRVTYLPRTEFALP